MSRRFAGGVAAALFGLALVGCGDDEPARAQVAEERITESLNDVLEDLGPVAVACPDDVEVAAGETLTCDVTVDGAQAQAVAFQVGEDGVISRTSVLIPKAAAEAYLVEDLTTAAEGPVEVTCGAEALIVREVGEAFSCTSVRLNDGATFLVDVKVTSDDALVQYDLTPVPTTGTTQVAPPP